MPTNVQAPRLVDFSLLLLFLSLLLPLSPHIWSAAFLISSSSSPLNVRQFPYTATFFSPFSRCRRKTEKEKRKSESLSNSPKISCALNSCRTNNFPVKIKNIYFLKKYFFVWEIPCRVHSCKRGGTSRWIGLRVESSWGRLLAQWISFVRRGGGGGGREGLKHEVNDGGEEGKHGQHSWKCEKKILSKNIRQITGWDGQHFKIKKTGKNLPRRPHYISRKKSFFVQGPGEENISFPLWSSPPLFSLLSVKKSTVKKELPAENKFSVSHSQCFLPFYFLWGGGACVRSFVSQPRSAWRLTKEKGVVALQTEEEDEKLAYLQRFPLEFKICIQKDTS